MEQVANVDLARLKRVRDWRIVLPVFLVSIIACIDRVNLAYAKLTMTADLPWILERTSPGAVCYLHSLAPAGTNTLWDLVAS